MHKKFFVEPYGWGKEQWKKNEGKVRVDPVV